MLVLRNVVELGGVVSAVMVADLRKKRFVGRMDLGQQFRYTEVNVGESSTVMDFDEFEDWERQWSADLELNEVTLAPKAIHEDDDHIDMFFETSRYSRYRAAADMFDRIPMHKRIASMRASRLGTPADFSHSLGVNCTLETKDNMLVLSIRSGLANGVEASLISTAMSEGATTADVRMNRWDPSITAMRGFKEELNIDFDEIISMECHSLIAQTDTGAISVSGHAITSLTAAEVVERQRTADDSWEAEDLYMVDMTKEGLAGVMQNPGEAFVAWAPVAIYAVYDKVSTDEGLIDLRESTSAVA